MPSSSLLTEQGSEPAHVAANSRKGTEMPSWARDDTGLVWQDRLRQRRGSRAMIAKAGIDSSATPCSRHRMSSRFGAVRAGGSGAAAHDKTEGSRPALACECNQSRAVTLLSRVASRVAGGWGVGSQQGCEQGLLSHGSARSRAASRACFAEPFVISSQKGTATAFQKSQFVEACWDKKTFLKTWMSFATPYMMSRTTPSDGLSRHHQRFRGHPYEKCLAVPLMRGGRRPSAVPLDTRYPRSPTPAPVSRTENRLSAWTSRIHDGSRREGSADRRLVVLAFRRCFMRSATSPHCRSTSSGSVGDLSHSGCSGSTSKSVGA